MLEKLDNNESVLLMYLAHELPAEDRAEIERMLAGDVSLRQQLAALRVAQESTDRAFAGLDAAAPAGGRTRLEPGSTAESAAIRRINRSMHSHLVRKLAERPAPAAEGGHRWRPWAIGSGAVAASILAALVWWANISASRGLYLRGDHTGTSLVQINSGGDQQEAVRINQFWPSEDTTQDQIGQREQELAALTNGGDDDAAVWKIGSGDAHD